MQAGTHDAQGVADEAAGVSNGPPNKKKCTMQTQALRRSVTKPIISLANVANASAYRDMRSSMPSFRFGINVGIVTGGWQAKSSVVQLYESRVVQNKLHMRRKTDLPSQLAPLEADLQLKIL